MTRPVAGLLLGVTAAVIFVAVTTPFAGSDRSLWWWPAVLASFAGHWRICSWPTGSGATGRGKDGSARSRSL
jgi:hypothetical protein